MPGVRPLEGSSGDVSRETSPSVSRGTSPIEATPGRDDAVLARLFPADRIPLLARYAELLATEGVLRGLIGPREVPRLWDRHLVNCALLAPLVPAEARVVDLGSGAGLPGLVLAIARPDLRITLVEPMARRTAFLDEVCAELALGEVEVVRARAEQLTEQSTGQSTGQATGQARFDVVTARALAPLPKLLAWGLPFVAESGALLALKGASAQAEVEAARSELARRGARAEVLSSSVPGSSVTTVVRVVRDPRSAIGWQQPSARRRPRRRPQHQGKDLT
jgi:16S rRNA (guanine527-N7)-methyltransferase